MPQEDLRQKGLFSAPFCRQADLVCMCAWSTEWVGSLWGMSQRDGSFLDADGAQCDLSMT